MIKYIHHKNIFLIDAAGAMLSLIGLFCIATFFNGFGLPSNQTAVLITVAVFCLISSCYNVLIKPRNIRIALYRVIFFNFLYALSTILLLFGSFKQIYPVGFWYYLLEIFVLIVIILVELKLAKQSNN